MKKTLLLGFLSLFSLHLRAQQTETFRKKGKTLILRNDDPDFDTGVKEGLVHTFFKVYPKLAKRFNPKATDTVEVRIDTAYAGVAYAHDGEITISAAWLHKNPGDTDVITHEGMHIVQSYPPGSSPGWLTEGIADYVRYAYGVDNEKGNWYLPDYSEGQHYTDSYRITARFLLWLSQKYGKELILQLDRSMRNKTYSEALWQEYTGHSLTMLWETYIRDPKIS